MPLTLEYVQVGTEIFAALVSLGLGLGMARMAYLERKGREAESDARKAAEEKLANIHSEVLGVLGSHLRVAALKDEERKLSMQKTVSAFKRYFDKRFEEWKTRTYTEPVDFHNAGDVINWTGNGEPELEAVLANADAVLRSHIVSTWIRIMGRFKSLDAKERNGARLMRYVGEASNEYARMCVETGLVWSDRPHDRPSGLLTELPPSPAD